MNKGGGVSSVLLAHRLCSNSASSTLMCLRLSARVHPLFEALIDSQAMQAKCLTARTTPYTIMTNPFR